MNVSKEYLELMHCFYLPDRFRAGDFGINEYEEAVLRGFVDDFYASVESNGCVTLEDFTEFMDFLCVLKPATASEAVDKIVITAFMKSAEIRNKLPSSNPGQ